MAKTYRAFLIIISCEPRNLDSDRARHCSELCEYHCQCLWLSLTVAAAMIRTLDVRFRVLSTTETMLITRCT